MKLNLIFLAMEVLIALSYPFLYLYSKPISGLDLSKAISPKPDHDVPARKKISNY